MEGIENGVDVEGFKSTLMGKGAEFVTNLGIVSGGSKMLSRISKSSCEVVKKTKEHGTRTVRVKKRPDISFTDAEIEERKQ